MNASQSPPSEAALSGQPAPDKSFAEILQATETSAEGTRNDAAEAPLVVVRMRRPMLMVVFVWVRVFVVSRFCREANVCSGEGWHVFKHLIL